MEPRVETAATINVGGVQDDPGGSFNPNRNNAVQGGLPYATVSLGPLLFALPLEKPGSEWRYALIAKQTPKINRIAMPARWDWPAAPPLTLTAKVRKVSNFEDVWTLPARAVPAGAAVELVDLVPYGCSKVFKVSMFPYFAE